MNQGNYTSYIHIESNAMGLATIPIFVQVWYQADLGDINYDGQLNVLDIILIVNIILTDN